MSYSVSIKHNPFIVNTEFLLDGKEPAQNCKLTSFKNKRLQFWIEELFETLSNIYNGDDDYDIEFTGVESDFLDLLEAAEASAKQGMKVRCHHNQTEEVESRLQKIYELTKEAQNNEALKEFFNDNREIKENLEEAFNRDFDVYVVATMSSGKSTLINAMLGQDILPAANEATTATIAKIIDNNSDEDHFTAKRFNKHKHLIDQNDIATLQLLETWNKDIETHTILLEGNIKAISEREHVRLVLTDTPGPNNSQDEDHERTTMGYIQDTTKNPLILYILNASQLGINDDKNLLHLVADTMNKGGKQSKDRFIFVVNKMDVFDPEKGENINQALQRVKKYLTENGIENPSIYPVSANFTRLIRKPSTLWSRREKNDYNMMSELFEEEASMNLMQYMTLNSKIKRSISGRKLDELTLRSGLPAVETLIDEYIDKYSLPSRLKRAYDAIVNAIELGLEKSSVFTKIQQDKLNLEQIKNEMKIVKQKLDKGFNTQNYKENLQKNGLNLPKEILDKLIEYEAFINGFLRNIQQHFHAELKRFQAESKLQEIQKELAHYYNRLINDYENASQQNQILIQSDLQHSYMQYVRDIFSDIDDLKLPILSGIKNTLSNMNFTLEIKNNNIESRPERVGSREEPDSKWYNPFSWGRTKTVGIYEDVEYVNMSDYWHENEAALRLQFMQLVDAARTKMEKDVKNLVDYYIKHLDEEFSPRFDAIYISYEAKLSDSGTLENEIKLAEKHENWINEFKVRLENMLAI